MLIGVPGDSSLSLTLIEDVLACPHVRDSRLPVASPSLGGLFVLPGHVTLCGRDGRSDAGLRSRPLTSLRGLPAELGAACMLNPRPFRPTTPSQRAGRTRC